jgi:hypothetical protein
MVGVHRFLQKQFMPTIFPIIPPRGFMASTRYRVSTRGCPVLHFRYKRPHYRVWLYDPTTGISHSNSITYSASMLFHGCMRTSRQTRWEVWSTATDDTYKSMPITSYVTVTKSFWNSGFDFAQWGMGTVRTRPITSERIILIVWYRVVCYDWLSDKWRHRVNGLCPDMSWNFNIMWSMCSGDCPVSYTGGNPRFTTEPCHQDHIKSPRLNW